MTPQRKRRRLWGRRTVTPLYLVFTWLGLTIGAALCVPLGVITADDVAERSWTLLVAFLIAWVGAGRGDS